MKQALTGIACILLTATLDAQAPPAATSLTLEEAIARGMETSRRLAELQSREEAAAFAVEGRHVAERPNVAVQGGYTRTNHVEEFVITSPVRPPQVVYPDIPDNYRTRLDLQWPIFTGGRGDALERAARAEKAATEADLAAARSDLKLEITRAFWALVTARETEAVLARSLDAIGAQVNDLRSRLASGLIAPNDVSSAEAQASHQRLIALEAANQRAMAEADLRRLTGIAAGRIEPRVAPADTRAPETVTVTVPSPTGHSGERGPNPGQSVSVPVSTRPERRALEQRAASAEARADAVDATGRPQIAVGGGYDYARPNPRIFPRTRQWRTSWDVSINLTWSLWDGGRRAADAGEARANARAVRARAEDFDRQATFEIEQRQLELASNREAIGAADDEVRAAVEAERVVGERYRVGVATSTDVLEAQVARLQAELDRTRAIAGVRLAEARLQRALGQ
jgi:outer membrane protein TolC